MKRSINVFLGALLTAVFIAACAPVFEPGLETNYTRQKERTDVRYFTVSAAGTLTVQPEGALNTLQTITITTYAHSKADGSYSAGYNLVINENNQIDGVGVYPVSSGTPNVAHGTTSLPYTAVYSGSGRDTVQLLLPLSGSSVTKKVVLVVDPALAKFNGDGKLNMDGDTTLGEPDEDVFYRYFDVTDYTGYTSTLNITLTAVTGDNLLPPVSAFTTSVSPTLRPITAPAYNDITKIAVPGTGTDGINLEGGTKLEIDGFLATNSSTAGKTNLIEALEMVKAFKFQRFDHDSKNWVDYNVSNASWDTGGSTAKLVVTFSEGAKLYGFYRYQVDPYQIAEKEKVNGFIHRRGYDQSFGYGFGINKGAWGYLSIVTNRQTNPYILPNTGFSVAPFGTSGGYYIDVTGPSVLSGTNTNVDLVGSTLTAKNIKMYYSSDGTLGTTKPYGEVDLSNAVFQKLAPNKFRIVLPASFVPLSAIGTNPRFQIRLHDVQVNYSTGSSPNEVTYSNVKIFSAGETDGALFINSTANF
jgi:hypothetical protein